QSPLPWMPELVKTGYIIDFQGYLEYQQEIFDPCSFSQSGDADFFLFAANNFSNCQVRIYLDGDEIYASPDEWIPDGCCYRDASMLLENYWMEDYSFY